MELHERIVTRLNDVEVELIQMRSKSGNELQESLVDQKDMETLCEMVAKIYLAEVSFFFTFLLFRVFVQFLTFFFST